jgi:succinate dehydrogenase/fumarate reductase flavoprotein subunit
MVLRRAPIELITYPHAVVGGINMDENARTNVPGLYAAGEATGGSHGASRFGGSALSDCLVFGAVGGTDAADYARKLGRHLPLDKAGVAAVHDKVRRWLSNEGLDPGEVLSELSAIAFRDLNMVRNEPGLNRVKDRMNDMRKSVLPKMSARGSNEKETFDRLRKAIESEGQTDLCDIIAHAALDRRESRGGFFGGHYRTEYPERDDNEWLKNIVLSKNGNGIKIAHEAPVQLGALSDEIKSVMATEWRPPNSLEYYAEAE